MSLFLTLLCRCKWGNPTEERQKRTDSFVYIISAGEKQAHKTQIGWGKEFMEVKRMHAQGY